METQNQTHPSRRQLAALALDKLKPESKARLQEHVASCSTCSTFVSKTPRDTLIALLRDAGSSTSASDQSTPGIRDAGTLVGIPIAAKAQRPPAAQSARPKVDALIEGGPSEVTPKGRLTDEGIPLALREQTKYRVVRRLGGGGMGALYEAFHNFMHRSVAIKIVNSELIDHPEALQRFRHEMHAVGQVDHPNIAHAYDADVIGALQVLVLELVPGQNLEEFLAQRKRLSVMEASRLVRQALVGLQHAHERGLVHRDLKPQNLMLTPDGKVKILDFGLAKVASERRVADGLTRENALMGTPHYLAPEQALDAAKADIRADIYSLGCTLYCLLAGEPPFNADTEMKVLVAHQNDAPRPLCEVRPDVPQDLSDFVDRMLAKDPADRPQTPMEAAQELIPFTKAETATTGEQSPNAFASLNHPTPSVVRAPATVTRVSLSSLPPRFWSWMAGTGILLIALIFGAWATGVLTIRTAATQALTAPSRMAVAVHGIAKWRVDKTSLVVDSSESGGEQSLLFGDPNWTDYDFSCVVSHSTEGRALALAFRCPDDQRCQYFICGFDSRAHKEVGLKYREGSRRLTTLGPSFPDLPVALIARKQYALKVEVRGRRIRGFLDGKQVADFTGSRYDRGRVGLSTRFGRPNEIDVATFSAILVTAPDGTILWQGPPELPGDRKTITLKSADGNGFISVFNGQDRSGWKTHPSQPNG